MSNHCFLSSLYRKWRDIKDLADYANPYEPEKTEVVISEELRGIRNFRDRISKTTGLLNPEAFEEYVKNRPLLAQKIQNDFPSIKLGTVAADIQREVMWKRNHIVHVGDYFYSKDDANRCINFAQLFILIFENMDMERRKMPD